LQGGNQLMYIARWEGLSVKSTLTIGWSSYSQNCLVVGLHGMGACTPVAAHQSNPRVRGKRGGKEEEEVLHCRWENCHCRCRRSSVRSALW
jgi:hypothetical protein